jgi:LysR family glycine cleavage system transcriptional activator
VRRLRAISEVRASAPAGTPARGAWLPPLNALHAFEAAGRHRRFKNAAAELCVTPSAVSRQIKLLEDHLGVPLFVRDRSSLALTAAGARYLGEVRAAFELMARATEAVKASRGLRVVKLSCVQALAANWLVPRLAGLTARHPKIEVQILTGMQLADVAGGEVDLAIRFGRGGWPGVRSEPLLELEIYPVATPALARRLRVPRDLQAHRWIHLTSYPNAFRDWLAAAKLPDVKAENNLSFDSADLVFRAAERGLGVAMATSVLVGPYLEAGTLVRLFDVAAPASGTYHLVYRADDLREPSLLAVRAFLREIAHPHRAR